MAGFEYSDGEWEELNKRDLMTCCSAKSKLAGDSFSNFLRIVAIIPSLTCKYAGRVEEGACQRMARGMVKRMRFRNVIAQIMMNSGPAVSFRTLYTEEDVAKLCNPCMKALLDKQTSIRKEAWNSLPALFGVDVPDWKMEAI